MTTLHLKKSIDRSHLRRGFLLIVLAFGCFALSPTVRAVDPPPDGGYPNQNTAEGDNALFNLTSGTSNTATGYQALFSNRTGSGNVANGVRALFSNINGNDNTAVGIDALFSNTTGDNNTATGNSTLGSNRTGNNNTATGFAALAVNSTGNDNTATGGRALNSNGTGRSNTATGVDALFINGTGNNNTATGVNALFNNTTGNGNTSNGVRALSNNTTGSRNIALGFDAGRNLTTGDNDIDIANQGVAGESGTTRIGKQGTQIATFIAGIFNVNEGGTIKPLYINSNGQLGTQPPPSSRRFKKEIKPMDQTSEAILGLNPVTFQYKDDSTGIPQFGLIAEEVAKANPDLVVRDDNGEIYTVRYEAVNAMLLNEFLKEHQKVAILEVAVAEERKISESRTVQQQKQIEALAASVQKMSDQLQLNKAALHVVANNP